MEFCFDSDLEMHDQVSEVFAICGQYWMRLLCSLKIGKRSVSHLRDCELLWNGPAIL